MKYDLKITYNDGTSQTVSGVSHVTWKNQSKTIEEFCNSAWFVPTECLPCAIYSEDKSASVQLYSKDVRSLHFFPAKY